MHFNLCTKNLTKDEHKLYSLVMMLLRFALLFCSVSVLGIASVQAFSDISPDDVNAPIFNHLRDIGVMNGLSDGNFYPANSVSRAEALAIALRTGKIGTDDFNGKTYFADVNPNAWYGPVVSKGVRMGILSSDYQSFRPAQPITKAEFLTFLFRATGAPIDKYKNKRDIAADIPNGEWFTHVFAYAKRFQIAHLPTDNLYRPMKTLTRREVAVMAHRQLRLVHGSATTAQVIELQASIEQFLALIKEDRYEEAEFHLHALMTMSQELTRTKNNQDSVGARALSQSMQHLSQSFRSFRFGKNLNGISNLHLALQQAERAGEKSEAMRPFAQDLSLLIHESLASLTQPSFAQVD